MYTLEEVMTLLHIQGGFVPSQKTIIATLETIRKSKTICSLKTNGHEKEDDSTPPSPKSVFWFER